MLQSRIASTLCKSRQSAPGLAPQRSGLRPQSPLLFVRVLLTRHLQLLQQAHIQSELKMFCPATNVWVRECGPRSRRAPTRAVQHSTWRGTADHCHASGTAAAAAVAARHLPSRQLPAAAVHAPATYAGGCHCGRPRHRRQCTQLPRPSPPRPRLQPGASADVSAMCARPHRGCQRTWRRRSPRRRRERLPPHPTPAALRYIPSRPRPPPRAAACGPPAATCDGFTFRARPPPYAADHAPKNAATAARGRPGCRRRRRSRLRGWQLPPPSLRPPARPAAPAAASAGCRRLRPPATRLSPSWSQWQPQETSPAFLQHVPHSLTPVAAPASFARVLPLRSSPPPPPSTPGHFAPTAATVGCCRSTRNGPFPHPRRYRGRLPQPPPLLLPPLPHWVALPPPFLPPLYPLFSCIVW